MTSAYSFCARSYIRLFDAVLLGIALVGIGVTTSCAEASPTEAPSPPVLDNQLFVESNQAGRDLLAALEKRLTGPETVRCRYHQERFVTGLKKPLTSSGHFLLYRPLGLAWMQESPFTITYVVTRTGMKQIQFEDGKPDILPAPDVSAVTQFTQLILSIFNGKLSGLSESFSLYPHGDERAWQLAIVPKEESLKHFIRRGVIQGGITIERTTIEEGSGDLVRTVFSDTEISGPPPTPEELRFLQ